MRLVQVLKTLYILNPTKSGMISSCLEFFGIGAGIAYAFWKF